MLLPRTPYSFRLPLHLTVCSCEICGKSPALLLSRVIPSDLHMIPTPTPRQNPAQRETGTTPAIHNKMAGTAGQHFHIRHTMIWTPTPYFICYKSQKQLRHKHCNASRNEAWAPKWSKWSSRLTTRCHWKRTFWNCKNFVDGPLLEHMVFGEPNLSERCGQGTVLLGTQLWNGLPANLYLTSLSLANLCFETLVLRSPFIVHYETFLFGDASCPKTLLR